jgi:hypothetical protein
VKNTSVAAFAPEKC